MPYHFHFTMNFNFGRANFINLIQYKVSETLMMTLFDLFCGRRRRLSFIFEPLKYYAL